MSIRVEPVDFATERDDVLAVLQANLPAVPHERRFKWLYRANPDGAAWSWLAREETGIPVGVTSVFPHAMWIGGQLRRCGQVGDFAVSAAFRSLGPAVQLQRATLEPVNQGELAFCYDCPPHAAGMATFRRLGLQPCVAIYRYALPLRVDARLRRKLGFEPLGLGAAGNLLLRVYTNKSGTAQGLEIAEHSGPFGEEFSVLDDSLRQENVIRSRRSAAHLNWRYREDPLNIYRVLTVRRHGELIAYLVFSATAERLVIVDVFGMEFPQAAPALLEAVRHQANPSHQSVEALFSVGNDVIAPFLNHAYRRREIAAQVVAYTAAGSDTADFLRENAHWHFQGVDIRT